MILFALLVEIPQYLMPWLGRDSLGLVKYMNGLIDSASTAGFNRGLDSGLVHGFAQGLDSGMVIGRDVGSDFGIGAGVLVGVIGALFVGGLWTGLKKRWKVSRR